MNNSMEFGRSGLERRKKKRVRLTRGLLAKLGTIGVVVLDVSETGSRVEHFTRMQTGARTRLRFSWEDRSVTVECVVVSCKVHRFFPGDAGSTVYQSGLLFTEYAEDSLTTLKAMVSAFVARSLAEQVANARGIGPVLQNDMPVFRGGVVATTEVDTKSSSMNNPYLMPATANQAATRSGYIRCRLLNHRWEKKWTREYEEPLEGFTVLATEPADQIEKLCQTYSKGDGDTRRLIRLCAQMSVEESSEQTG